MSASAEAWEELARRRPALLSLALRLLGHEEDAEDATQAALVRAAANWSSWTGAGRRGAWLRSVLVNCARDVRRRSRGAWGEVPYQVDDLVLGELVAERPEEEDEILPGWTAAELAGPLRAELCRLKPRQRDVLRLVLDGYTHAEAGRLLGCSASACKLAAFRGRRVLDRRLRRLAVER